MGDYKILVTTPISHLSGLRDLIRTKGEVYFLERGKKNEVRNLILKENINAILCNPNKQGYIIDEELIKGTKIKLINTCSTGLNHIDLKFCEKNNIKILSLTKDYELINDLPSTSELAFGLMLSSLRKIHKSQKDVKNFNWNYEKFIGTQIKDLKIGIIGFGRLGKLMVKYCNAFGAKVSIFDPNYEEYNQINLEDFISYCDVISLHVHVNEQTKKMINRNSLVKSKANLLIINTSRGEIVEEKDIISLLKEKKISGYSTDVIADEFGNIKNSELIKYMDKLNIEITPHVGGMTYEGQLKAFKWAINKF